MNLEKWFSIVWFYLCFMGARVWFMSAADIQSALKWFQLIARHADNSARLFTMHNRLNFLVIFISVNVYSAALCCLFSLEDNAFSYWYLLCLYFCYSWTTFYQLTIRTSERNPKIFCLEPFIYSFVTVLCSLQLLHVHFVT